MKTSRFNILSHSKDDPSKILLYNTLYDHRILFEDPGLNPEILFDKIRSGYGLTAKESEAVPKLKEMGVLVDDDIDEQKLFERWYETKIRERTDLMQITILPTMACNLACDYCFENEVRESGIMKPETTEKIVAYLKRKLSKVRPGKVHITYFGGEPLLHQAPIKKIQKEIWAHCRSLGIPLMAGAITNGVLLTPEFVDEVAPYGFEWVKITFDGDREAHDKKRIYHNRKGTFDVIYNNLCAIKGKLRIAIGGNFDNENYESMFALVERLKTSPFVDDIMIARFKPIMKVNADIASQREGRISAMCEVCTYNTAQTNGIVALEKKTWETGLPVNDRADMGPCEYHSRNSFTIGPDGTVYKCPAFVGLKNLKAGDVDHDGYNDQGEWQVQSRKYDDDCEQCRFLPNCAGGCRYSALNKTGSLEVKSCDYKHLEAMTEEYMQRELIALDRQEEAETEDTSSGGIVPETPTIAPTARPAAA